MSVDWRPLRHLASRQYGVLTRSQCLAAGLDDEFLRWRVQSRRWLRLHPGAYLTLPGKEGWRTSAFAVLLAAQSTAPEADVAFRADSAAHWWGLRRDPPTGSSWWCPRVVTLPSLLVPVFGAQRAGRRWSMTGRTRGARRSRSPSSTWQGRARPAGLPAALRQSASHVGSRRVHDNDYAAYRLLVEVDGRLGHERWSDRVKDGRRDRLLLTQERVTTRVFWADVAITPCDTGAQIGAILRARGWPSHPRPCRRSACTVGRPVFGDSSG